MKKEHLINQIKKVTEEMKVTEIKSMPITQYALYLSEAVCKHFNLKNQKRIYLAFMAAKMTSSSFDEEVASNVKVFFITALECQIEFIRKEFDEPKLNFSEDDMVLAIQSFQMDFP